LNKPETPRIHQISMAKDKDRVGGKSRGGMVGQKFQKRSTSLLRKANELACMTGADIYIQIYRNDKDRYLVYSSAEHPGWPSTKEVVVGVFIQDSRLSSPSITGKTFPHFSL
jgi:hypothetical protein